MRLAKLNGIFVLLVLAGLMFSASSCTQTKSSTGNPYVGGSSGLSFSFVPGSPPPQVYDNGQTFSVGLHVKNNGEFGVNVINFSIYGVSSAEFNHLVASYYKPHLNLSGATKIQGGKTVDGLDQYITLTKDANYGIKLPSVGDQQMKLTVSACYPYETVATIQVCLKKNYNDGRTTVCTPATTNSYYVSGAPVQITNVQESTAGQDRFYVDMTFESKSNGEIYSPKAHQDCQSPSLSQDIYNKNQLWIKVDARGNAQKVSCSPLQTDFGNGVKVDPKFNEENPQSQILTGYDIKVNPAPPDAQGALRLTDGKAQLRCYFTVPQSIPSDGTGTISVSAQYYVKDVISQPLTISHAS